MSEHAQPGLHPDLDALSAFAEGGLAEHERLACLDHLAECAQCREIVYLTQAAEAAEAKPAEEPKRDPVPLWKRWLTPVPVLSTAAVAALVATSLVIYRHQTPPARAPQPELMAKVEAPPAAVPAPQPVETRAVRPKPRVPSQVPLRPKPAPTSTAPAAPPPAAPAQVNLGGSAGANSFTSSTNSSGQFSVAGVPPGQYQMSVDSPGFKRSQNEIQLQPSQVARADSVSATGNVSETVAATAGAASVQISSGGGGRGGRARAALMAAPVPPKPALPEAASGKIMLRADATGALFRSTNAGKSWKAVKGKWSGRIVRLVTPPDASGAGDALFQLNTDNGEVWLSRKGDRWTPVAPVH